MENLADAKLAARFDARIAEAMIAAHRSAAGLPGFLGAKIERLSAGKLVASMEVRDDLLTPLGSLHGGVIAALVDHVLGCVLYPLMEAGQWAATTEFKLNYLAAVRRGKLTIDSTVVGMTRRTAVVRVEVTNDERLACIAQGTLLIVDPPARS